MAVPKRQQKRGEDWAGDSTLPAGENPVGGTVRLSAEESIAAVEAFRPDGGPRCHGPGERRRSVDREGFVW